MPKRHIPNLQAANQMAGWLALLDVDRDAALSVANPSHVIDKGAELWERGDPERALHVICGYRARSADMREVLSLYSPSAPARLLCIGCHDGGKTHYAGALKLIWEWFCGGCVEAADGRPRGAILALMAQKESQLLTTSWKACWTHAEAARHRGWELPGFKQASPLSVSWRAIPHRWFITPVTYQAPAGSSREPVISSVSGLKHPHAIHVWCEEADKYPASLWRAVEGWKPRTIFGALNPYSASGPAYDYSQGGEWDVVWFNSLRVDQVRERRVAIDALADHKTLEREMLRGDCQCLGAYPDVTPDDTHHDFIYACPRDGTQEAKGRRKDGYPGSSRAPLEVWRPNGVFTSGRLGLFPTSSDAAVFGVEVWRRAVELGARLGDMPSRPPDAIGVDTAEGGPDRVMLVPRWGPSAADVWRRYQVQLDSMATPDPTLALALALRCESCSGRGCGQCYSGLSIIRYGSPIELTKTDIAEDMASNILTPYGTSPRYMLDGSAGGHWVAPYLRRSGATAHTVAFGGRVDYQPPAQRTYLNQRAAMAGKLAYGLSLEGAVALPDDSSLRRQAHILEWVVKDRADGKGGKGAVYALPDKLAVKGQLGGQSPDHCDAWMLTEAEVVASVSFAGRGGM